MSERTDQISALVAEYNQTEAAQAQMLQKLFDLINAGRGGRIVRFSSALPWTNCWNWERRDLALPRFVDPVINLITDYASGED